jgi:hypothetical protein
MWKTIWKLRVLRKVKIYIWRIMHETIPCRMVLANQHVPVSAQCPLCQCGAEDIKCMLFECPRARLVWEQLGLGHIIENACMLDRAGQSVLEFILCTEQQTMRGLGTMKIPELVVVTSWYLWWERRRATMGEKKYKNRNDQRD